jgi:hypothetical protein
MPRTEHHDARGAMALVLAVLLLLAGALTGPQSHVTDRVTHTDVHHTGDIGLGTLAVAQSHRAGHPQRPVGHPMVSLPARAGSPGSWSAIATSAPTVAPACSACPTGHRDRAPPA